MVVLSVWVLDESDIIILVVVVAGNIAVADSDVAVAFGGSRCGTRVDGVSWGEQGGVGQLCKSAQTQTHDTNNIDQVGTRSISISCITSVPKHQNRKPSPLYLHNQHPN